MGERKEYKHQGIDGRSTITIKNFGVDKSGVIALCTIVTKEGSIRTRISKAIKLIFTGKINQGTAFNITRKESKYLLEVVSKLNSDSSIIKHAISELTFAGYFKEDENGSLDKLSALMAKDTIELLATLSTHEHSVGSIGFALDLFNRLARYKVISNLTFKDDEWVDVAKIHDTNVLFQNKRYSSIFKENEGIYNIDAFNKEVKSSKYFNSDKIVKYNGGSWSGTVFESVAGIATGRGFRRVYFKDEDVEKGCIPKRTISIPVTQVEVQSEDWLMFVDSKSVNLKELNKSYRIDWFEVESLKDQPIISLKGNHGH